jgi:hypothetical protein
VNDADTAPSMPDEAWYAECHTMTLPDGQRAVFPLICCAADCPARRYGGGLDQNVSGWAP